MISVLVAAVLSSSPVVQQLCFARAVDGGLVEVSPEVCAAMKPRSTSEKQTECLQLGFVPREVK